ncbi:MAG: HD domain-containing protein [Bacilli bacterium]|jgi:dGTPase|nr:HD domain-containing protein [Bacilli bacterium]
MKEDIKIEMNKHNSLLSDFACSDDKAEYLKPYEEDIRPPFFRDIDRIIYSLAFIRYQDKTQVFSNAFHDHISKRMIHVQFVSKIARTIGRALGLNEDLIEAAALGHDLGHTPFGHNGETILNELSLEHNEGYFNHNVQSVRNLMIVENYGKGLNISVQVMDAILCHNGEIALGEYHPTKKAKEDFLAEYNSSYKDKNVLAKLKPMTLEGCVVRISDLIAYLGRDIDDALRMKLITREDIPKEVIEILGKDTRSIVNTCVLDIINNSFGKNYIKISDKVYNAIGELMKFNYQNIYFKSATKEEKEELKKKFRVLFDNYILDIKSNNSKSPFISSFLANMSAEYKANNSNERIIIDYISGMTDDYFKSEYERIITNA